MTDRRPELVDDFLADLGAASVPADLEASVGRRIRDERPRREARTAPWMLLAAAFAMMAMVAAIWMVAGPGPTPVPNPSPSAPPSVEPSVAPSVSASPSEPQSASPTLTFPPDPTPSTPVTSSWRVVAARDMAVLVNDHSGSLVGAQTHVPLEALAGAGPWLTASGDPTFVDASWLASPCDRWAQLDITPGVASLDVRTGQSAPCAESKVAVTIRLQFADPVDPAQVRITGVADLFYVLDIPPSAVAFADSMNGLVGGMDGIGRVWIDRTADGGATWRLERLGHGAVTGLGIAADGTAWAAITCDATEWDDCVAGVYRRDGGTWTRVLDAQPTRLAIGGGSVAALVTGPLPSGGDTVGAIPMQIRRTFDGGTTWVTLKVPCGDTTATAIGIDSQARLVVVCEAGGATGSALKKIWRSVGDVPGHWETIADGPYSGTGMAMSLAADGTGWLWGSRSPMLATKDGGTTWTPLAVADGDVRVVRDADATGGGRGTALVWDPDRQATLLLTTSDGKTWTEIGAFEDLPCCGG